MEPRLHGPDWTGNDLCDLVVGQVLRVKQYKNQTVFGPKPIQSPIKLSGEVIRVCWPSAGIEQSVSPISSHHRQAAAGGARCGSGSQQSPGARV